METYPLIEAAKADLCRGAAQDARLWQDAFILVVIVLVILVGVIAMQQQELRAKAKTEKSDG